MLCSYALMHARLSLAASCSADAPQCRPGGAARHRTCLRHSTAFERAHVRFRGCYSDCLMSRQAGVRVSGPDFGARSPLQELQTARNAARHWADSLGEDRLSAVRRFVVDAIASYTSHLASKGVAWVEPAPPPSDLLSRGPLGGRVRAIAGRVGRAAVPLRPIDAAYWLSVTYTGLLPRSLRLKWGVYYTPPALTVRLLDIAEQAGTDWTTCTVLDPACGGGAFLGPVATRMARGLRLQETETVVTSVTRRLQGFEIDPFAAWMSQTFLELALSVHCHASVGRLPRLVRVCDALESAPDGRTFDLVIGNPPYGRAGLPPMLRERYSRSLYGHANLYGVFTDLALRWTAPGGVIAYVTPTSFLAGQYFKALRQLLASEAPPAEVDVIDARIGVFEDVLQETMLAAYRRGGRPRQATVSRLEVKAADTANVTHVGRFELPKKPAAPWLVPRCASQSKLIDRLGQMSARLADWGYSVSTGPLVWNRHKSQLRSQRGAGTVPLIWAEAIAGPDRFVYRAERRNHETYFQLKPADEWLKVAESCVLLQRTTAKEQDRRLVAATLPQHLIDEFGSVVVENHVNMVRPLNGAPAVAQGVLVAVLNSEIVDSAFRCISGSVAVSAFELESLPLPSAEEAATFEQLISGGCDAAEIEEVLRRAYLGDTACPRS